jgi:putative CocE/NonD family hydrolase
MTTRDGVRLDATVWRPEGEGPWPALLMRQPYGRDIASTVTLAHPSWYAARGYVVVVQDVRGTGTSGGTFRVLSGEAADGAEAAAWAAGLSGVNGHVGSYGFSYQAMSQFMALGGGARLSAICPAMGAWDQWRHNATAGGAFQLARAVGWAMQMAAVSARHAGDGEAYAQFAAAQRSLPADGPAPALPEIAQRLRHHCHLADWVEHDGPGPFWDAMSPAAALAARPEALATPALHVGGWFDYFLPGTIEAHAAFRAAGAPTRLVIGPWGHLNWGARSGPDGFGEAARGVVDPLQAAWLDRFVKGRRNGVEEDDPILLFDVTRGQWRGFRDWPDGRAVLFLAGDGRAAPASSGRLTPEAPADTGAETFVHDPWRPAPARGGWMAMPDGPAERSDIDDRADVAVFETEPLEAPLRLAGAVDLSLALACPCPSLDVVATLSRVRPDGRATTLAQGVRRVGAGERDAVAVCLRAVCATVEPGERLRLSLAGAAWPAIAVNPGDGTRPETAHPLSRRPIPISVITGGSRPSRLTLSAAP